ncbi:MAG: cytochrome c oxidase assembly protein [Erythrobacter sp.]|uniref:cytochrome c oxidase assembly protein n=1 Tax=Erythrobacter sp. HL-111 TaxID=1798193 RepID=UPI0006DA6CF2|nr:cytochrome c oxidase assembly protein [Erythrobacter sp. HL-111]KPP93373.1 MAG: aa3-type cytochrome c oxidase assembly protein subunit CoxG [Erythrobacteraceae bacterium HL-111]SDR71588.1 cytochrome c oxidase assembly protein subunit 11 [Erythrobacter sp. HL-111]
MGTTALDIETSRRNLRTGLFALLFAAFMLGLGYAAVPLYDLFCRVTGFAGTTQVASEDDAARAAAAGVNRTISVRFDASTASGMPWSFRPDQRTETVRIGERDIATYTAVNNSDEPITGTATFNVEPAQAGRYFQKVQCFCFTEQTLQPGEKVNMPVLFYIDPAIEQDEVMADVEQITLSYTFHRAKEPVSSGLAR